MAWSFDVVTTGWRAAGEGRLVILQATTPPNIAISGLQPEPLPLTTTPHTQQALAASLAPPIYVLEPSSCFGVD